MFNCCSHGTLLIFGLQSSCLNIWYYHQDLHPRRLHPRPRIPRHALLLHLPGGAGETCRWCAPSGDGGSHLSRQALAFTFIAPWGLVDTLWLVPALDSLVRVSRRVEWVADLTADLEHPLRGPDRGPDGAAWRGRRRTEDSPPRSTHVPGDAKCVRSVDDQCVLQFTLVLAASCVLHRRRSRVIWRYVSVPNALPGDDLSEVSCGAVPGFRHTGPHRAFGCHDPRTSLNHPIGSSDERCVQRAGT